MDDKEKNAEVAKAIKFIIGKTKCDRCKKRNARIKV